MFIPGETITFEFVIPFLPNDIDKVILTFKQDDHIILVKTITSGFQRHERIKSKFSVLLSQQEALLFEDTKNVEIQINVLTIDGTRGTCAEIITPIGIQQYRKVISNN